MSDLTSEQKKGVLPSKTFLKEKFLSSGEYERTRSRLVGGGHRQDKEIYENNHSPTVATQSVFMIAAIAAGEGKAVATVDFPSAFLNCELPDDYPPIYMKLGAFESMVLAKYDPSMAPFLRKDGTMIVRLKRGLYGLLKQNILILLVPSEATGLLILQNGRPKAELMLVNLEKTFT